MSIGTSVFGTRIVNHFLVYLSNMSVEKKRIFVPPVLYGVAALALLFFLLFVWNVQKATQIVQSFFVDTSTNTLHVSFLDIGQGDATFIRFPTGETMLVDCAKDKVVLPALGRVLPFWQREIDYLIVTHPDSDHYGGCIDVLDRYRVKEIILNGFTKQDNFYKSFTEAVRLEQAKEHVVTTPFSWHIGGVEVAFLYPDHDMRENSGVPGNTGDTESNNTSIIMKVSYGFEDILLTGDAEKELEEYLVQRYGNLLDVEVLKAGHHGSPSSSIAPFVSTTSPLYGIFSAGRNNTFGHPSERVIRRFERVGSSIWRTDTQGDIRMKVFIDAIEVQKGK